MKVDQFLFQISGAEKRFADNQQRREQRETELHNLREGKSVDISRIDCPTRIARRMMSQSRDVQLTEAVIASSLAQPQDNQQQGSAVLLERIINGNDLLSADFLAAGQRAARTVGRVVIRSGSGSVLGFGTGFMVSPRLALTNNHVLESASVAGRSTIQFDFVETLMGTQLPAVEFRFVPGSFFETNRRLDFTLVAVAPANEDNVPIDSRGWNPLIAESGKSIVGERVNLLQHPDGSRQQLALRQNTIVDVVGDFLHYIADTRPGSSGSPVFNDQWQLAALHHAGVPKKDNQGRILLTNGQPWNNSRDDIAKIEWVANEGTRISRIVSFLRNRHGSLGQSEKALLAQAFDSTPPPPVVESATTEETGPRYENGKLSWRIPIDLSISLPTLSAPDTAVSVAGSHSPSSTSGDSLVDEISQANINRAKVAFARHKNDVYYDAVADAAANIAYYADIEDAMVGEELFDALHQLVTNTHTTRLRYDAARYDHLYPFVDLRPDRTLASIYSGKSVDFEDLIVSEAMIEARHELEMQEFMLRESDFTEAAVQEFRIGLESQDPFNCEHIVVQSWFHHDDPMKSDLHHLTTCEPGCNSTRNNNAYFEFNPDLPSFNEECGQVKANDSKFEPVAGKGLVARATLYYLLRYPKSFDHDKAMGTDRLSTLLKWHADDPVSEFELHRNAEIQKIQGNRNPLIDFPLWAEHIPFDRGL